MSNEACIAGLPRSGTTWVGKIFDSSPETLYLHEPDYVVRIPCVPYVAHVADWEVWRPFIEQWLDTVRHTGSWRTIAKQPRFPKSYLASPLSSFHNMLWWSKLLSAAAAERLSGRELSLPLPQRLLRARFLVWKTVESLGRLGVMAAVLPQVRFFHIVRHPCGFVDSVLRGDRSGKFQKSVPMSEDMGLFSWSLSTPIAEQFNIDLQRLTHLSPAERLAWFWLLMNAQAFEDCRGLSNVLVLSYDKLAEDSAKVTNHMYRHMGLPVTKATERFVECNPETSGQDYYSVERSPRQASQRWRDSLASDVIDQVEKIALGWYDSFQAVPDSFSTAAKQPAG